MGSGTFVSSLVWRSWLGRSCCWTMARITRITTGRVRRRRRKGKRVVRERGDCVFVYASTTEHHMFAKNAGEVEYANITGCALLARSAGEVQYANTTSGALHARSVEEDQYAVIAGSAVIARSVGEVDYANTTSGAMVARSATALKHNAIQARLPNQLRRSESELPNDEPHHHNTYQRTIVQSHA